MDWGGMHHHTYGMEIGKWIGEVIEVDVDQDGLGWGLFLQARILVDISKPLVRDTLIKIEGKPIWIPFKYERLPSFCFYCDIIKHPISRCPKSSLVNKIHGTNQTQYGP